MMTQAQSSSFAVIPTRKVITYFHITKGFLLFNITLTLVLINVSFKKKLIKSLAVSILFITFDVGLL